MGLADDAYNTNPVLKFLAQWPVVGSSSHLGNGSTLFDPNGPTWRLTLFWVVGMMNSINMLDNMDGITTSVSIAILVAGLHRPCSSSGPVDPCTWSFWWVPWRHLFGFLFFNWNPRRMYMGDTGSQFLGVFLAFVGIRFFWNAPLPLKVHIGNRPGKR
jgi:UDP-GlcNAc:undecaprenyl-phosphate GlcNAc-1-phosphate transferase